MAITHELIAVTGEYKTKDGQVKTSFQKVGVAMENAKGGTSLLIEALPIKFDGWIHMRLPTAKKDYPANDQSASKSTAPEDIESDSIPF